MRRFISALILLLLALSALPNSALADGPAIVTATTPDRQYTLYSDLHRVELESHAMGQRIQIDLAGISAITWMDNESALLNREDGSIFIVDLAGHIFYLGNSGNPSNLTCGVPSDAFYIATDGVILIWGYPTEIHVVYCGQNKEVTIYETDVIGVYLSGQYAFYVKQDGSTWRYDTVTGILSEE